jgi:hypothetical protein
MTALAFWRAVVQDKSNFLERIIGLLEAEGFPYCVIGGVAVNAYVEPVVTQDLDIVLAIEDLERLRELLAREFRVDEFEHSVNVHDRGSKLQVQIQKDPDLSEILERAERRSVLDLELPVAAPGDLVRLKVAAALEPSRRASKRGKDVLDLGRLLTRFPEFRAEVPEVLMARVAEFMDEAQ